MPRGRRRGGFSKREVWTGNLFCFCMLLLILVATRPDTWDRSYGIVLGWQHSLASAFGLASSFERSWARLGLGPYTPGARKIMQTWKDADGNHRDDWLAANPSGPGESPWEYFFLTDASALSFLRAADPTQGFAEDFGALRLGAMKADFLRLIWLHTFGGFYIDQDLTPTSLQKYEHMADVVLVKAFYDDQNCTSEIYNAFMYTRKPRSALIARMIALARRRIARRSVDRAAGRQSCYAIAGPTLVAVALREAMLSTYCRLPENVCPNRFNGADACNLRVNTLYTTEDNETVMLLPEQTDEVTKRTSPSYWI